MAPTVGTSLNRRDAVTSLLAMLANVVGTSPFSKGVEAEGAVKPAAVLLPTSNLAVDGYMVLVSWDPDRPRRELNASVHVRWIDGEAIFSIREFTEHPKWDRPHTGPEIVAFRADASELDASAAYRDRRA